MILFFLFLLSDLSAYSGKSYKNYGYYEFFVESAKDLKTLRLLDQRFHCTWLYPHEGEFKILREHSWSHQTKKIRMSPDAASSTRLCDFTCKIRISPRAGGPPRRRRSPMNRASPNFALFFNVTTRWGSHPHRNRDFFFFFREFYATIIIRNWLVSRVIRIFIRATEDCRSNIFTNQICQRRDFIFYEKPP